MPKIVCVTPFFPPDLGGLELYAWNIMKRLAHDFGWDVVVITSQRGGKTICTETQDGLKIYRLPIALTLSNTPINPLWPLWIRRILAAEKPDLINVHAPVPYISDVAALVAGTVPVILTYHAGTMKKNRLLPDLVTGSYERFGLPIMARHAEKIICPSDFVRRTMMRAYADKTLVIHPGVDLGAFTPRQDYDPNTVLFIGRSANMYAMKGLYHLIDAVKSLPNIKLKIVGEPLEMHHERITFVGIKHGQKLIDEIQSSALLILPSLADKESFGMVLIEAMACALPVIGTNAGGIPEVINDGVDGYVVPPANPDALARAIERILSDPDHAQQMGQAGRLKVETQFTWEHQTERTHRVLMGVL